MIAMNRCSKRAAVLALYVGLSACATNTPPTASVVARPSVPNKPVVDDNKGDPQARFASALKLMHDGRTDEAEIALLVLSHDFPQFSGPATDLGILYAKSKRNTPAEAAFAAAIKANPNNAVALNWLGQLSRERRDYTRAEQYYQRAIAAHGDYAPAHFNLAILYDVALQRPEAALTQYRAYQKLAGTDDHPMVAVWIRELEMRTVAASGNAPAGAAK